MNRLKKCAAIILAAALIFSCCLALSTVIASASGPTDEISDYDITAVVNEDATVTITYYIDWLVLEDAGVGPLEWVSVGIPNSHASDYPVGITDNIKSYEFTDSYGSYINLYFDRQYRKGETVSFGFQITCDYMYEMNANEEGYTVYYFTPGWFDDIAVDNLTVRWASDKLYSWSGNCKVEDGYNTWTTSLDPGESIDLQLVYPNDAFGFDTSKSYYSDNSDYYYSYDDYSSGSAIVGLASAVMSMLPMFIIIAVIASRVKSAKKYAAGAGFTEGKTETKVTHTKVVYYDTCPGCGAPRQEGKSTCQYCGRDLIKSEEIVKEEDLSAEEKKKYKSKGEYKMSAPDTYMRVNVIHVPIITPSVSRPVSGFGRGAGRSGGGSRSHSSCVHSSCACASCACACAGGGRAGCTTKDFYNTNLKLEQLKKKTKRHNE